MTSFQDSPLLPMLAQMKVTKELNCERAKVCRHCTLLQSESSSRHELSACKHFTIPRRKEPGFEMDAKKGMRATHFQSTVCAFSHKRCGEFEKVPFPFWFL